MLPRVNVGGADLLRARVTPPVEVRHPVEGVRCLLLVPLLSACHAAAMRYGTSASLPVVTGLLRGVHSLCAEFDDLLVERATCADELVVVLVSEHGLDVQVAVPTALNADEVVQLLLEVT